MERYIGMDAHASSCTLGVVGPSGKRLGPHVVETNAAALIEVLRAIGPRRHVYFEEGTLSEWLHEMLEPHLRAQYGAHGIFALHKSRPANGKLLPQEGPPPPHCRCLARGISSSLRPS